MRPIGAKADSDEFISVNEFCESVYEAVNNYNGGVSIKVAPYMPTCIISPKFHQLISDGKISINYGCGFSEHEIIFDPHGNILLCLHLPDVTMGNIGNISDMSSFLQEMRAKVNNSRRYPMSNCKDCNIINDCYGGGCPVLWLTNKYE